MCTQDVLGTVRGGPSSASGDRLAWHGPDPLRAATPLPASSGGSSWPRDRERNHNFSLDVRVFLILRSTCIQSPSESNRAEKFLGKKVCSLMTRRLRASSLSREGRERGCPHSLAWGTKAQSCASAPSPARDTRVRRSSLSKIRVLNCLGATRPTGRDARAPAASAGAPRGGGVRVLGAVAPGARGKGLSKRL